MNSQQKQEDTVLSPERIQRLRIFGFINNTTTYDEQDFKSLQQLIDEGYKKLEFLKADFLYRVMIKLAFLVQELEVRGLKFTNLELGKVYINAKDKLEDQPFLKLSDHVESNDSPFERYCKLIRQIGFSAFGKKNFSEIIECLAQDHYPERENYNYHFYSQKYYLAVEQNRCVHNEKLVQVYKIKKHSCLQEKVEHIIMKMATENSQDYLYTEIKILEKLNSKHLSYMYYYTRGVKFMLLFMRYNDVTLEKITVETPEMFRHIMIQVLTATKELHNINIIHRDLKPQNIMFDSLESLNCVLIDFDRSKNYATQLIDIEATAYEGTQDYQPPEGTEAVYHTSYDCWQLGLIFLELCSEKFTQRLLTVQMAERNKENEYNQQFGPKPIGNHLNNKPKFQITPEQKNIIISFLSYDPSKRMSIDQALQLLN